jgi:hypothetical protein
MNKVGILLIFICSSTFAQTFNDKISTATKDSINIKIKEDSLQAIKDFKHYSSIRKRDSIRTNRLFKNSIYAELIGNTYLYSLNYERVLFHRSFFSLTTRIAGTYFNSGPNNNTTVWMVPVFINSTFKFYKSFFGEIGVGAGDYYATWFDIDAGEHGLRYTDGGIYYTGVAGFRYQAFRGFLLRVDFTPQVFSFKDLTSKYTDNRFWFGFSLGYSF